MFSTLYDLVGEAEFNAIVGGYYQQYANGGTTGDFIAFAKKHSTRDLSRFFDDWIYTTRWTTHLTSATSVHDLAAVYGRAALPD
jgi:aminopeptidase N